MRAADSGALAQRVRGAARVAVLTGAGVSTASGIPDFRSASGLYADPRNANVFDIDAFDADPAGYYAFARTFYPMVWNAQPNAAHRVLARWEQAGRAVEIATQNIDDLHQRAGSRRVYAVHGDFARSTCRRCGHGVVTRSLAGQVAAGEVPRCACGGVYKPDITFFGERLPAAAWQEAVGAMARADLVLVLGTSLAVQPAAALPSYRRTSAAVVVVNRDPTWLDAEADLVFSDPVEEVLAAVDRCLS